MSTFRNIRNTLVHGRNKNSNHDNDNINNIIFQVHCDITGLDGPFVCTWTMRFKVEERWVKRSGLEDQQGAFLLCMQ